MRAGTKSDKTTDVFAISRQLSDIRRKDEQPLVLLIADG
jgi:hypothetical protein